MQKKRFLAIDCDLTFVSADVPTIYIGATVHRAACRLNLFHDRGVAFEVGVGQAVVGVGVRRLAMNALHDGTVSIVASANEAVILKIWVLFSGVGPVVAGDPTELGCGDAKASLYVEAVGVNIRQMECWTGQELEG
jgi:hypothetical protein